MQEGTDLLAYVALSVFPVSFFLLSTYGTAQFSYTIAFAVMFASSVLALMVVKVYLPDIGEEEEVADFDENLTAHSLAVAALLGASVLVAVSLLARLPYETVLLIPRPDVALFAVGPVSPELVGNILYQFTLVAPAEETLKVVGVYALWTRLEGLPHAELPAVAVPVGLWAAFHTLLAGFSPWMVVLAFAAGVIFYAGMRFTGSILTAYLAHAFYNSAVIALGG